jgi:hypothetical protein
MRMMRSQIKVDVIKSEFNLKAITSNTSNIPNLPCINA